MRPHTPQPSARSNVTRDTVDTYLSLVDAIRLATLPGWITADLTISQVKAVFLLAHHAALSVGELAAMLDIGNPAASILVQQLVEQALVERTQDHQDRRRTLVSLTAQGTKLISGRHEQREARLYEWLEHMPEDDLLALLRGLKALTAVVRAGQVRHTRG